MGAAGGALVLGTGGAATGLVAGGVIGAVVGVVPALFTFGLSIPFLGVVGSSVGVAAGTALGSTTGAMAGASGYRVYRKREAIRGAMGTASEKALRSAKSLRARFAHLVQ